MDDACPEHPQAYANEWGVFEIYCRDFFVAGRYAAAQNWSLHCWEWRTDADAPEDPVVTTLRTPSS